VVKTILCYGDSITWGSNPDRPGTRHAREDRWPEVMRKALGPEYHVMAEGLRGRTTAFPVNMADCDRNGAAILPTLLYTHAPLDLVILMLGTNDLQTVICGKAVGAQMGMRRLVEIVKTHSPRLADVPTPKVLILAPPHLVETPDPFYADLFAEMVEQSRKIAPYYAALARELGVAFFDAATVATASPVDGVHLDATNTRAIGQAVAPVVREMLTP
jgi:lysophospholipase L1-like esterase